MKKSTKGITVLEILIVLGILMILLGLMVLTAGPAMAKSKSEPTCAQQLKQIAVALNLYVADNDGVFPPRRLLGDGGTLATYHLKKICPLETIGYHDSFGNAMAMVKWADKTGFRETLTDPLGRPVPQFDPTKDILARCLAHGYEGFNALSGKAWNRSSPKSKGKLLSVRYDTSVSKAPVVSCWELRYIFPPQIPFLRSWKACDRP